ncbi:HypC/HybG/HupF family hydrogenase formation chaperone [Candidatus Aenigmatarchaeota archaeon]
MLSIREEDRRYFMKYAVPCAQTLVDRCVINKEKLDEMFDMMKNELEIPDNEEDKFKVAMAHCSLVAMRAGKKEIDKESMQQYFFFEHDDTIDKRHEEMGDFDSEFCRTFPAIVKKINVPTATVDVMGKERNVKADFVSDVIVGDKVVIHRDFITEKIDEDLYKRLINHKEEYFSKQG